MKEPIDLPNHPNLTPDEVRTFLKISRTAIYDMLQQGIIPRLKVGVQWRIPRTKFLEWYEQQQENENSLSV